MTSVKLVSLQEYHLCYFVLEWMRLDWIDYFIWVPACQFVSKFLQSWFKPMDIFFVDNLNSARK
jgi:hypothetical protein